MSFSYEGPKASNKDCVRYLIGEVSEDTHYLTDNEILFELEQQGVTETTPVEYQKCVKTALQCCDSLLARFALEVDYAIGPEKVNASQKLNGIYRLKKALQAKVKSQAAFAPIHVGTHECERTFKAHMMDNLYG